MKRSPPSSNGGLVFVLDLKGRPDLAAVKRTIESLKGGEFWAATPSAFHCFQALGLPCMSLGDAMDYEYFSCKGREAYQGLRQTFVEIYGEKEHGAHLVYSGYELKILLDSIRQEDMKYRWLREAAESRETVAATDAVAGEFFHAGFEDYRSNDLSHHRVALYLSLVQDLARIIPIVRLPFPEFPQHPVQRKARGLASLPERAERQLKNKALYRFSKPRNGGVLISNFGYGFLQARHAFSGEWRTVDDQILEKHYRALRSERRPKASSTARQFVEGLWSNCLDDISGEVKQAVEPHLVTAAEKMEAKVEFLLAGAGSFREANDIRLVLTCGRNRVLNVFSACMREKTKTFFSPHSPLFHDSEGLDLAEGHHADVALLPARHTKPYIRKSLSFHTVGSMEMSQLRPTAGRAKRGVYLYVLYAPKGANEYVSREAPVVIEFDGISIHRRHLGVIDRFSRHPDKTLVLRPVPSYPNDITLYEPLLEYINGQDVRNVTFDRVPRGPGYLSEYECVIFDYMVTGFTQALFMKVPRILGHLGGACPICDEDVRSAIEKTADCARTDEEFFRRIDGELSGERSIGRVREDAKRTFLERYAALPISEKQVVRNVLSVLNEELMAGSK